MDEATDKMSTTDWNDDVENTDQLRAEIEDTRAEMSQTINEIQERLSPENVMDQVKEKVREATIGKVERVMNRVGETIGDVTEPAREVLAGAGSTIRDTGRSAADVIWRNPIPVALVGLGVGLLVMRAVRGNGSDYDTRRTSSGMRGRSLSDSQMGYDTSLNEYDMGQGQHKTFGEVRETASELAHRSTETLNNLKRKASDGASQVTNRCAQLFRENPLAMGAVAIAAGTAVGLAIPSTRLENEYIGETSDRFVDKAQEVAREAIDKVQNVAQQQMSPEQQPMSPGQQQRP